MMRCSSPSLKNLAKSGMYTSITNFIRELLPDKTTFLGLLETLARVDETVVREQVGLMILLFNIGD